MRSKEPSSERPFRKKVVDPFVQTINEALEYFPVMLYFYVWSIKAEIRHFLKLTSLVSLVISTVAIAVEVFMESAGGKRLHKWILPDSDLQVQSFAVVGLLRPYFMPVLFALATAYLLWHHYTESKKPGYEFRFVGQLQNFMHVREANKSEDTLIPAALGLFYKVFEHAKIQSCSVFSRNGDGLMIRDGYVFSKSVAENYKTTLKLGEGVAGLVLNDLRPRYVPLLFFPFGRRMRWVPSVPFPHAVTFDFHQEGDFLELINDDVDRRVFKTPEKGDAAFRAFVSVPIKSVWATEPYGVLNFDFSRTDPLDRADIAIASILGLILADELHRLAGSD